MCQPNYLQTLKFEFCMTFICHKILFFLFLKIIEKYKDNPWPVSHKKQVMGCNLPTLTTNHPFRLGEHHQSHVTEPIRILLLTLLSPLLLNILSLCLFLSLCLSLSLSHTHTHTHLVAPKSFLYRLATFSPSSSVSSKLTSIFLNFLSENTWLSDQSSSH